MSSHNERKFSISEFYVFLYEALSTFKYMKKGEEKIISKVFTERIMLAVTEVNGCKLCSYKHTQDALKQGMSKEEINELLGGTISNVPVEESVGIFFAQHYAEQKGRPTKESWNRLVEVYGKDKALAILAATRTIMMGNVHGKALGALKSRIQGEKVENSSLGHDILLALSILPFIPIALIHVFIDNMGNKDMIRFSKE